MTTTPDTTRYGFPPDMPEIHRKRYAYLEEEIAFNVRHGINEGYTEHMRNEKHLLVSLYIAHSR